MKGGEGGDVIVVMCKSGIFHSTKRSRSKILIDKP